MAMNKMVAVGSEEELIAVEAALDSLLQSKLGEHAASKAGFSFCSDVLDDAPYGEIHVVQVPTGVPVSIVREIVAKITQTADLTFEEQLKNAKINDAIHRDDCNTVANSVIYRGLED